MEVGKVDNGLIPFSRCKEQRQNDDEQASRAPTTNLAPQGPEMYKEEEDDQIMMPGFRFHPTDEELVGFYLRRKVQGKLLRIELIKELDIYKYEPSELPKVSCSASDKEWYFFTVRGRKYRNSVRPNRVTGTGFWKATGIDRPIYSSSNGGSTARAAGACIGLKKSLVYYRGSAGKGTKTDWMMHEFRLPAESAAGDTCHEVESWTLCRIFKRNVSQRKYLQILSESTLPASVSEQQCSRLQPQVSESSSKSSSTVESSIHSGGQETKSKHRHCDGAVSTVKVAPWDSYTVMYNNLHSQNLHQTPAPNSVIDSFLGVSWDELDQVMGFNTDQ